jgi:hypothetical protein
MQPQVYNLFHEMLEDLWLGEYLLLPSWHRFTERTVSLL